MLAEAKENEREAEEDVATNKTAVDRLTTELAEKQADLEAKLGVRRGWKVRRLSLGPFKFIAGAFL